MRITPFSFVHCADLHLGSPFEGVHAISPGIAEVLRGATFKSFDNIIQLAIRRDADFLIVAGDVYDGADRNLHAQWRSHEALRRAVDSDVQCLVAHGNHDPLSGWEELAVPDRVHRFGGGKVDQIAVKRGNEELAHVYGISYESSEVKENLVPHFPRGGDSPFDIGVLHCNVGGNTNHDNYSPCTMDDLVDRRMDYWALGHIHARGVLQESNPCIIYPGNAQGRSVRELGARGCYLVNVDETGLVTTEFVATDVVRWFVEQVDIDGLGATDDLINALRDRIDDVRAAAEGRATAVRFFLGGHGILDSTLRRDESVREIVTILREESEEDHSRVVWVDSVQLQTRPEIDIAQRRRVEDFIGEFLRAAENLRNKPDPDSAIRQLLTERPEHRVIMEQLDRLTEKDMLSILEDAELLAVDLLLEGEE